MTTKVIVKSALADMPVVTVEQIIRFRTEALKIERELAELKAKIVCGE